VQDLAIAAAQTTADGKNKIYRSPTPPTATAIGDTWFDTDDGNKLYFWNGTAWIDVQDDAISAAQATADSKIKTFYQTTAPTATGVGDIWFDTDDDYKFYRYNADPNTPGWVGFTLGDNALDSISANKITAGTIDASVITVSNLDAGNIAVGTLVGRNIIGNYLAGGSIDIGGTSATVSNKQILSNEAILTTTAAHGFSVGDSIVVANVGSPFDGVYTTIAGTTGSTIKYALTNTNITSVAASGTVQSRGGSNSFHVSSSGQIWSGATTFAAATFKVSAAGSLTATLGSIAGWTLSATELTAGSLYINSNGNALLNTVYLTYVGGLSLSPTFPHVPAVTGGSQSTTRTTAGTLGFLRNISYGADKPTTPVKGDIHFSS
jgi:hypothetical protein